MTETGVVQFHETFSRDYHLSRLSLQDTPNLVKNLSNPSISKNLEQPPFPYTLADAQQWHDFVQSEKETDPKTARFRWVIRQVSSQVLIGDISLRAGKRDGQYCVGYWLAEDYWGKGIMSGAVAAAIKIAREAKDVERIVADVKDGNWGSRRVLEKNGFRYLGDQDKDCLGTDKRWLFELEL
jgi:[ribosomal protein S5]-alanine N-acetyltransferase